MSPIDKAKGAVEMASPFLTDPILRKRMERENIWELLATAPQEISKDDIWNYLRFRCDQLADLVKDYKTMTYEGEAPECSIAQVSEMKPENALTHEDLSELAMMFSEYTSEGPAIEKKTPAEYAGLGARGKFSMTPKAAGEEAPPAGAGAPSTLDDARSLLDYLNDRIFDIQLQMELTKKNEELKAELLRVVSLVKSGKIDAVWILIALANVNCSRNGLLFSQMGMKMMRLNQMNTKVTDELLKQTPLDPQYAAHLQIAAQKQKEFGMQQQFLVQDMQKVTQNIETTLSFAKKSIDEIFKTRLHIINAPFKSM